MISGTIFDPGENVWSGPRVQPIFHPDISIGQILEFVMPHHYSRLCQVFEPTGESWTFQQFHSTAIKIAKTFLERNISQNDVIGICASNTLYVSAVAVAAFLIGAPISTLDPSFDSEGIQHIFGLTRPSLLFCDQARVERVSSSLSAIKLASKIYVVDDCNGNGTIEEFLAQNDQNFKAVTLKHGGDQIAALLCSSGSTGLPKAVNISHKGLFNLLLTPPAPDDIILSFSTLYWVSGLLTTLNGLFSGACRILTNRPFSSNYFIDIIEKEKVSLVFGPPSQMALLTQNERILTADLSSLKNYFVGGSAVPFSVTKKLQEILPNCEITVVYGMTEISALASVGPPTLPCANGFLNKNICATIVDGNGNRLGVGKTGEICIKVMNCKWSGYYGNPEATKDALAEDGWIKSGDLGYFDNEGRLFIVDRKKDIMKYKNFHYFPTEIEMVILELPDVVEACVCGLPDLVMTDLPAAAIIKKAGSKLSEKDVIDYVAKRMVDFKHLRGGVFFMEEFPKTASGKNIRRKVKELIMNLAGI